MSKEIEMGIALLDVWDQLSAAGALHHLSRPLRLRIERLVEMPEPGEHTPTTDFYRTLRRGTRGSDR